MPPAGGHPAVALASYERGETHRLRGDYDAAEAAYDEAVAHGHFAQPGRALLWLGQGRVEEAVAASRRSGESFRAARKDRADDES